MSDENNPTELPPPSEVQNQNQTTPASIAPPPPAATLAVEGEVTDERALAIARREKAVEENDERLRGEQINLSEQQKKIQEREEALRAAPTAPVKKVKRARNFSDPIFSPEEIEID